MPVTANPSDFRAPLLLAERSSKTSTDEDAQRDVDSDVERLKLVGFAITALLERHPASRTWWATRLDVSKGHITKMASQPTRDFVLRFDAALAEERSADQRLRPQLADFLEDVLPEQVPENPRRVLETIAREPLAGVIFSRPVEDALLWSEVALARAQIQPFARDLDRDRLVRTSIDQLLRIASGPYGASHVAAQRCAELGLLAPAAFLELTRRHLYQSPVGFRALRCLQRFAYVWRRRQAEPRAEAASKGLVEAGLIDLLIDLAGQRRPSWTSHDSATPTAVYVDPYPGGEWGIGLARERLKARRANLRALQWLRRIVIDDKRNDRERLYATFCIIGHVRDRQPFLDKLAASGSMLAKTWAQVFSGWDPATGTKAIGYEARKRFAELADDVDELTATKLDQFGLGSLHSAMSSVVFAALITPDGRWRRALIEGVVAGGIVEPAVLILHAIYERARDPSIREATLFFLSRLREPRGTMDYLSKAATAIDEDPFVLHTALWAMGDVFGKLNAKDIDKFAPILLERAIHRVGAKPAGKLGHESLEAPLIEERVRIAAAHALAVMGANADTKKRLQEVIAGAGSSAVDLKVVRMARWGQKLQERKTEIVDPTVVD